MIPTSLNYWSLIYPWFSHQKMVHFVLWNTGSRSGSQSLELTLLRLEKAQSWSDRLDALIARELPFGVPVGCGEPPVVDRFCWGWRDGRESKDQHGVAGFFGGIFVSFLVSFCVGEQICWGGKKGRLEHDGSRICILLSDEQSPKPPCGNLKGC